MFWDIVYIIFRELVLFSWFAGLVHIIVRCICLRNKNQLSFKRVLPLVIIYPLIFVLFSLTCFLAFLHINYI